MSLLIQINYQVDDQTDHVVQERLANGGPVPFRSNSEKDFMRRLQLETLVAIKHFFKNKKFHAGGSIPRSALYNTKNFHRVVSTPFTDGIDLCYDLLEKSNIEPPSGFDYEEMGDWHTCYILGLLEEAKQCQIPTYLQAGIMVLYFQICHGHKLPQIDLDITHLVL